MKYIYTNISKRSQFLLLPDAAGTRQSNIFLVPYEHITLEYPGLHQYVPTVLRVFIEKEEVSAVEISEPVVELPIIEPVIEQIIPLTEEPEEKTQKDLLEEITTDNKKITESVLDSDEESEEVETSQEGVVTKKRVGRPSKKV